MPWGEDGDVCVLKDGHVLFLGVLKLAVLNSGHEADARLLQQQLSSLVSEQQAAQQYITDNPPPPVPPHHIQQGQQPGGQTSSGPSIDWKWDILRPINLPTDT